MSIYMGYMEMGVGVGSRLYDDIGRGESGVVQGTRLFLELQDFCNPSHKHQHRSGAHSLLRVCQKRFRS